MYAKLENEKIDYAPTNFKLDGGNLIVNFHKSDVLMKKYGFKEVIDVRPTYDLTTEYLTINGYTETETNIIVNYVVKQLELIDKEPTIEENITQLKATDTEVQLAIAEIYEMLLGGN